MKEIRLGHTARALALALLVTGCESAAHKAERALDIESELRLTNLLISQLQTRYNATSSAQRQLAISDTIRKWQISAETLATQLAKLRR